MRMKLPPLTTQHTAHSTNNFTTVCNQGHFLGVIFTLLQNCGVKEPDYYGACAPAMPSYCIRPFLRTKSVNFIP